MRVVFLEDVAGVAQGGDVKEVKNGFARNYLIPQRLATPATKDAMQRIRTLANDAEVNRLKTLADMRELSKELDGTQVNIEMRAGASGGLYGSVTNAIVAEETGVYDLRVRLHAEVDAGISLVVFPVGADAEEFLASLQEPEEGEQEESTEGEAEVEVEDAADEADVPDEPAAEAGEPDEPAAEA